MRSFILGMAIDIIVVWFLIVVLMAIFGQHHEIFAFGQWFGHISAELKSGFEFGLGTL